MTNFSSAAPRVVLTALVVGAMLMLAPRAIGAAGSLVGDTVTCDDGGTAIACNPASNTVSESVIEFQGSPMNVDVAASSITVRAFGQFFPASGQIITIGDLDFTPAGAITSIQISRMCVTSLPDASITFTANSLTIALGTSIWTACGPQLFSPAELRIALNPAPPAVNQPPVLDPIADQAVTVGQLLQFEVNASDPDGNSNALVFSMANEPAGATLTDHNNGTATFSFTPDAGQVGTYPDVTIVVTDAGTPQQSASRAFNITVNEEGAPPVNRPPLLDAINNRTVSAGETLEFSVTAADPDGDALSFAISTLPMGSTFTDQHDGSALFSWTPSAGQAGTNYPFTVTVTDNGVPAESDAESFTVTVDANQPPVLAPIGNRTVNEGSALTIVLGATDPDGDALTFAVAPLPLPSGAVFTDNHDGTASFDWTPASGQAGSYALTFSVMDNGAPQLSDDETITVTVTRNVDVDLDFMVFRASNQVRLGRGDENRVDLRVIVRNDGLVNEAREATIVGLQNGLEVYRQTRPVSAWPGRQVNVRFPGFVPTMTGNIEWTASIADDDPDLDEAMAVTHVVGRRRGEGHDGDRNEREDRDRDGREDGDRDGREDEDRDGRDDGDRD